MSTNSPEEAHEETDIPWTGLQKQPSAGKDDSGEQGDDRPARDE